MRNLILSAILFQLAVIDGMCGDSLAVFEIKSTGSLARSASTTIPANTIVNVGFESNNQNQSMEFNQGVIVDFGGGAIAVRYQGYYDYRPWGDMTAWDNRSYKNAALQQYQYGTDFTGPCTITFFCKNASLRGAIYSKTDYKYASNWTRRLVKPSSSELSINVPLNQMGGFDVEEFGFQLPSWKKTIGLANSFVISNRYSGISYPYFGSNSSTSYTSSVVKWATVGEIKSQRQVYGSFIGPMNVKISYTNKSDTNSFAFISYYISPATYSYNTTSRVNVVKDEATPNTKNVKLVFEKSTDNKKWIPADSMYVTETIGQAFYRIRNEEF